MSWRNALALDAIKRDADRVAPGRSHASDGTIGDPAHAASISDHNPAANGIVHAVDITNDPAHGFDGWRWAQVVADRIRLGLETRVKYLVSNDGAKDVIFNPSVSLTWRQNGSVKQEHRNHLHISIRYEVSAENDQRPIFVADSIPQPHPVAPPSGTAGLAHAVATIGYKIGIGPVLRRGAHGPAVVDLQFAIVCLFPTEAALKCDGDFGPATETAIRRVQKFAHLTADGVVGPRTRAWLSSALHHKFP